VALEYLTDDKGQVRKMAPTKEPGVVWIFGMLVAPDAAGKDVLLGHYGRHKGLTERVEHGIAQYDDERGTFALKPMSDELKWQHPDGNALRVTNADGDYFYFGDALPVTRVPARYESVIDPKAYEALAWSEEKQDYVWQKEKAPATQAGEAEAIKAGKARFQFVDAATGDKVVMHRSSVQWNAYRQCWIMIGVQHMSKVSVVGEVWYAEAPSVSGPWRKAVKVASHPKYSFYNPRLHPYFDQEGGRFVYFEGTYTETFSGNPVATLRYDYNQVMYRLDLADERLKAVR
jgi:hypothetical protein